jgi:hypothetical protein
MIWPLTFCVGLFALAEYANASEPIYTKSWHFRGKIARVDHASQVLFVETPQNSVKNKIVRVQVTPTTDLSFRTAITSSQIRVKDTIMSISNKHYDLMLPASAPGTVKVLKPLTLELRRLVAIGRTVGATPLNYIGGDPKTASGMVLENFGAISMKNRNYPLATMSPSRIAVFNLTSKNIVHVVRYAPARFKHFKAGQGLNVWINVQPRDHATSIMITSG